MLSRHALAFSLTIAALIAAPLIATPHSARAEGDAAAGEAEFKRCRACHSIISPDEVIVRGGKTGPNLWDILGRTAGTVEGYRYDKDMIAAGEAGLIWDEEGIAAYIVDPKGFIADAIGAKSARVKMPPQRVKAPQDLAAYLATFSAAPASDGAPAPAGSETPDPQDAAPADQTTEQPADQTTGESGADN